MTKTVRFHELGGPDVLRLESLPDPPPGPGELRLRVSAIGLNRAEALFRRGEYRQKPELPSRIGFDAVGIVDALGPGVSGPAIGDRVATIPAFHMSRHGVYGELAVVPAEAVVPWPEALPAPEAAALWTAWLTVWGGMLGRGELRRGDYVLLTAAASSVGLAAIQVARAEGATPIATSRSRGKRERLLAAGAAHVIVTGEEDLAARVREITGGRGVDVVFDAVAGPGVERLADVMAPDGRLVIYGFLGGLAASLPLGPMMRNRITLRGYSISHTTSASDQLERAKDYILQGVGRGAFRPVVDRTFPLDDIADAHRYLERSEQIGKVIVLP